MGENDEANIPQHQQDQSLAPVYQRFSLGQCVVTPGALVALIFNRVEPYQLLARHVQGDWGDLTSEDKALNDQAVTNGGRVLSAYSLTNGEKIWVITESDRSATTLLLPSEY